MTDKELKRLNRAELLELLLEQSEEIVRLREMIAEKDRQLADKDLKISKAGSIATASLSLSGVFESVQKAADLYLENVKRICSDAAAEAGRADAWNAFLENQTDGVGTAAGPDRDIEPEKTEGTGI